MEKTSFADGKQQRVAKSCEDLLQMREGLLAGFVYEHGRMRRMLEA